MKRKEIMWVSVPDYLANTMHLTTEEHGVYFRLLMFYEHNGLLPKDERRLATISHCSLDEWMTFRTIILALLRRVRGGFTCPLIDEWTRLRTRRPNLSVMRLAVFERDDYTCQYCGNKGGDLECDHVNPVSRGGKHDISNLTTACSHCNRSKGARSLPEWQAHQ